MQQPIDSSASSLAKTPKAARGAQIEKVVRKIHRFLTIPVTIVFVAMLATQASRPELSLILAQQVLGPMTLVLILTGLYMLGRSWAVKWRRGARSRAAVANARD